MLYCPLLCSTLLHSALLSSVSPCFAVRASLHPSPSHSISFYSVLLCSIFFLFHFLILFLVTSRSFRSTTPLCSASNSTLFYSLYFACFYFIYFIVYTSARCSPSVGRSLFTPAIQTSEVVPLEKLYVRRRFFMIFSHRVYTQNFRTIVHFRTILAELDVVLTNAAGQLM